MMYLFLILWGALSILCLAIVPLPPDLKTSPLSNFIGILIELTRWAYDSWSCNYFKLIFFMQIAHGGNFCSLTPLWEFICWCFDWNTISSRDVFDHSCWIYAYGLTTTYINFVTFSVVTYLFPHWWWTLWLTLLPKLLDPEFFLHYFCINFVWFITSMKQEV